MVNRDPITGELILDKKEKLTFGKYQGKSLATVSIIDPEYLEWLANSDGKYKISDTWRQHLEDLSYTHMHTTYSTYMR